MLASMLLHVVETARPIHVTDHRVTHYGLGHQVGDPVALLNDISDEYAVEPPGIEWLTAGCGIERRPIEVDPPPTLAPIHHGGFEIGEI
jgi:hypothetical protein